MWCELGRRCELWIVNGNSCLRLFEGETLMTEEPLLQGALWAQALALRTWRPGRRHGINSDFVKGPDGAGRLERRGARGRTV
jgi:hypothetical protein